MISQKVARISLPKAGRLVLICVLFNLISQSFAYADASQRNSESEALLIRKERQVGRYNYNFLSNIISSMLSWILVIPGSPANASMNITATSASLIITEQFWLTFFSILQYLSFFVWFALLLLAYIGGVLILFIFQFATYGQGWGFRTRGLNSDLFRSFDDETLSLFDKVTGVGYNFLDRTGELYNLAATPECIRYAFCQASSTLGDQEANGFAFKDMFRSLSNSLDIKAGFEGMSRSVNVGLLTGECDEPIMSCPELTPYFKKVSETWSNYL